MREEILLVVIITDIVVAGALMFRGVFESQARITVLNSDKIQQYQLLASLLDHHSAVYLSFQDVVVSKRPDAEQGFPLV